MIRRQDRYALHLSERVNALDGHVRPNPDGLWESPIPDLFAQLMRIVCGNGTVLIERTAAARMGLPHAGDPLPTGDAAKGHPVAAALRDAGFACKEINRWFHVKHDAHGSAAIGLTEYLDADHFPMMDHPRATTAALAQWHQLGGQPWTGGGGDAGNAILRTIKYKAGRKMERPVFWSWAGPDGDPIEMPYLPTQWVRPSPTVGDRAYGYDRVRAYLSAMTCTEVAGTALTHDGRTALDPKRAGWWLVQLGDWHYHHLMPDPAGYSDGISDKAPRLRWLTTPRVQLLAELAADDMYTFEILDSWTAPATNVIKTYGKALRLMWDHTRLIEDDTVRELVRAGVKGAYQMGHGYMRSRQSSVQRPDWAAAITATSAANTWRRAWVRGQAGGTWLGDWPMWLDTDNLFYPRPIEPDDWVIWDGTRPDLDDVTALGHWRTGGTRPVSPETGLPIRVKKEARR